MYHIVYNVGVTVICETCEEVHDYDTFKEAEQAVQEHIEETSEDK